MRKVLIAALLMLGAVSAEAASEVNDICNEDIDISRIYVASVTATSPTRMDPGSLDSSTGTAVTPVNTNNLMNGRKYIKIENLDRNSIPMRCVVKSSSTLAVNEINFGSIIASSGSITLAIPAKNADGTRMQVWCRSTGALVSTAAVTQCGSK